MDINKHQVGNRIRNIRGNDTMEIFGKKINSEKPVKSGIISRWENGVSLPNKQRLDKIAEIGNVTVEDLLYGNMETNIKDYLRTYCKDNNLVYDLSTSKVLAQKYSQISYQTNADGVESEIARPPESFEDINLDKLTNEYKYLSSNYTQQEKKYMKSTTYSFLSAKKQTSEMTSIESSLLDKLDYELNKDKPRKANQTDFDNF